MSRDFSARHFWLHRSWRCYRAAERTKDDQRRWIKSRDAGAKFYKDSRSKSKPDQRYWQYVLDSIEA